MNAKTTAMHPSPAIPRAAYTTDVAASRDGTTIGYRQLGHGPGVVLLHGTMSSSHNHMELAEALADAFTVYVPDRRGRGLSGRYRNTEGIRQEVDDLEAVLTRTGAHDVFGVSSGGIIALQAALSLPAVNRAAIFEPPLFMDRAAPTALLTKFDGQMAEGKVAAALITAMKGAQMGPPIFMAMPRWLTERLTSMAMNQDEKRTSDYVSMRALAPTLHFDFKVVAEASGSLKRFMATPTEVLLMGGSKSPAYLKTALAALEKALPNVSRVELEGLDHAASWNRDRGGRPQPVADELRRFFSRCTTSATG